MAESLESTGRSVRRVGPVGRWDLAGRDAWPSVFHREGAGLFPFPQLWNRNHI